MTVPVRECLIVFTRYPEPGTTKTRLIPLLGAEGAAQFQRQMAEDTLAQAKKLQELRSVTVEVHFTGGDRKLMQDWLGTDLIYQHQNEGDLGKRMASAFEACFAAGRGRAVIIGVDCPDLNAQLILKAFEALEQHDLVLGPAEDGGYYLIGLNRLIGELFVGVSWGTSVVRQQTVEIAKKLDLAIAFLPLLNDIDNPQDLTGRSF